MPPPGDAVTRYVLQGRLVTMGPMGVVDRGSIYVDGDTMVAVQPADAPPPPGFDAAPRIAVGGTVYPGLMDLHNHLAYNAMPLWDVPQRYIHSAAWKGTPGYQRRITKPSTVLALTGALDDADNYLRELIRFVECRSLLGGTTTSQGLTLADRAGLPAQFRGFVRNAESPDHPDLPRAKSRIGDPETDQDPAVADGLRRAFLRRLQSPSTKCYLQHLGEGTNDNATARSWFLRLRFSDGASWALNDAFCGIHCTALLESDYAVLAAAGASMVWSPLSNYMLYGRTADIGAARASGITIGLGCDWAPSGSKNVLGEMKVAWLASQQHGQPEGPVFSPEEIVAMATRNAARILRWDRLGTLEPGKLADLVVVRGRGGDDYLRLIEAREQDLTFVAIGGVPRVGTPAAMDRLGLGAEERITVGGARRTLNLRGATEPLDLGEDLGLSRTRSRLAEALSRLDELAAAIDERHLSGSLGTAMFARGSAVSGESEPSAGKRWRLVLDLLEGDQPARNGAALGVGDLADFVEPMPFTDLTVADDDDFLPALEAARNLPEFIKVGLPPLYGLERPLPDTGFVELRTVGSPDATRVPEEVLETTRDLRGFLRTSGYLTRSERRCIVDQSLLLLQQNYVHLPFKRAMHAVDPVQQLLLLRDRLDEGDPDVMEPEIDFHREMMRIFAGLRDLHTAYRLPAPFRGRTAWLPFQVEECWEQDERLFLVTKVLGNPGPPSFVPGVELLFWNGTPIERAVWHNADRGAGSNAAARFARGLNALTMRPLGSWPAPDSEWVDLQYRDLAGAVQECRMRWLLFEPRARHTSARPDDLLLAATGLGYDAATDDVQESKAIFYGGRAVVRERANARAAEPQRVAATDQDVPTDLPLVFRARPMLVGDRHIGYLRIFTFNVDSAARFVEEMERLLGRLPQDGLILDVRGNAGGLIPAAEQALQLLTPHRISPEPAQFVNSPLNLRICAGHAPSSLLPDFSLAEWVASLKESVRTGATYSLGFPISDAAACNAIGQRYFGPVVLVTDPLCYSATDIFAAGFQDHGVGRILGVNGTTGAGGANVWSHALLAQLAGVDQDAEGRTPYAPLPKGADLRVAVRRMVRVGPRTGGILEDLGVVADQTHRMTRGDILEQNRDLARAAAGLLGGSRAYRCDAEITGERRGAPVLRVRSRGIDRIDLYVDGRPQRTFTVRRGLRIELGDLAPAEQRPTVIELEGFDDGRLVARRRIRW